MGEYSTVVRLTDKGADVQLEHVNFLVARRDAVEDGRGCPIEYIVTALGS
jgi:hypothetical protein